MFEFLNRSHPVVSPATVAADQVRNIHTQLAELSQRQPRTDVVWQAIEHLLKKRSDLKHLIPYAPKALGYLVARSGGQRCETCEQEITRGAAYVHQPGTGGLVQHVSCLGKEDSRG